MCAGGCGYGGARIDSCAAFSPIRPAGADIDIMSDALARQILVHDQTGAALCGWRP